MLKPLRFTDHAEKRRRQRGFTPIEIQYVLEMPSMTLRRNAGCIEAFGEIRNRLIKIIYREEENYIKIISVM